MRKRQVDEENTPLGFELSRPPSERESPLGKKSLLHGKVILTILALLFFLVWKLANHVIEKSLKARDEVRSVHYQVNDLSASLEARMATSANKLEVGFSNILNTLEMTTPGQSSVRTYVERVVPVNLRQDDSDSPPLCRWVFDKYAPSEYETLWTQNIKKWQDTVCDKLQEPMHLEASREIIRQVVELKKMIGKDDPKWGDGEFKDFPRGKSPNKDYKHMSKFYYKRECFNKPTWTFQKAAGTGVQLIEPLWGFLRDPFDVYCKNLHGKMSGWSGLLGQSKEYVLNQGFAPYAFSLSDEEEDLENESLWHSHGIPPWVSYVQPKIDPTHGAVYKSSKNIMLDLGSSYFESWHGDANASSGLWFYNQYYKRGIEFDRFIQVEADDLNATVAWDQVPLELVPKYTLMNVPISMTAGSKFKVDLFIKSSVEENDFFVLKVDIDTPAIENPLVESFTRLGGAGDLVDELYFEHHVNIPVMVPSWGKDLAGDMDSSYRLFTRLRERGIRTHSWP